LNQLHELEFQWIVFPPISEVKKFLLRKKLNVLNWKIHFWCLIFSITHFLTSVLLKSLGFSFLVTKNDRLSLYDFKRTRFSFSSEKWVWFWNISNIWIATAGPVNIQENKYSWIKIWKGAKKNWCFSMQGQKKDLIAAITNSKMFWWIIKTRGSHLHVLNLFYPLVTIMNQFDYLFSWWHWPNVWSHPKHLRYFLPLSYIAQRACLLSHLNQE